MKCVNHCLDAAAFVERSLFVAGKKSTARGWLLAGSAGLSGLMVVVLWTAVGQAYVVEPAGTESSAGGVTDDWLVTRGLIGHGMVGDQSGANLLTPAPGVEVEETRETEDVTGEVLTRVKLWDEMVGDDTIHIEIATLSSSQFEVSFWLFPNHQHGCTMYQWTLYDHRRALQSTFWRNDAPALRLAGAADLPHDLYPDAVPWMAFLRVLDAPRQGAEGALYQQLTPYSYVGQDVFAKGTENISVPAGHFAALKVIAQVDIATVMPNWPRFVMHVVQPVVPKNILYFEAAPPYRLLKQEGATFVGGPDVTTELMRFYVAGAPTVVRSVIPAVLAPKTPLAAVIGSSAISVK
jgi:hypothetical protein